METIRITTSQNIDIDYEVAGLGERIVGRIIDIALFVVLLLAVMFTVTLSSLGNRTADSANVVLWGVIAAIYIFLFVFYDLICEAFMNGQSIGKKVMKIKVISLNGARPTMGQYLLRWLFRIVDFSLTFQLGGLLAVAVSEKHQRIGDMVAGTTLIKTAPRTKIDHVAFLEVPESYDPIFPEAAQLSEKDIALVQEVINTYVKTQNSVIVYNMALRIREHLGVTQPVEMNDMKFLQTIVKDYGHLIAAQEGTL